MTDDEVAAALSRLDPTKATGFDKVSARVLKTTAPAVSSSLCHLFNTCLRTSQFPSEWKAAKIIPIPKSAQARSADEYRPISILPVVAKVLEFSLSMIRSTSILSITISFMRPSLVLDLSTVPRMFS